LDLFHIFQKLQRFPTALRAQLKQATRLQPSALTGLVMLDRPRLAKHAAG